MAAIRSKATRRSHIETRSDEATSKAARRSNVAKRRSKAAS